MYEGIAGKVSTRRAMNQLNGTKYMMMSRLCTAPVTASVETVRRPPDGSRNRLLRVGDHPLFAAGRCVMQDLT